MTNPPKKRSTPLTREEVLDAALRIADQQGVAGITMRKVGDAVGVEAMSLYHHVPNKDALLDGVVERTLIEMRVPDPLPEDWRDLMEAMLAEFRRVLLAHPGVLPLVASRPPTTSVAAPYMRVPLQLLSSAGLSEPEVVGLYQSLLALTFGHSLLATQQTEATGDAAGPYSTALAVWDESTFRRGVRALIDDFAPGQA